MVPRKLAADAVCNGSDELSTKSQVSTEVECKLFGVIVALGDVPLELIDQGDVTDMDVQLDDYSLIARGVVEEVFAGVSIDLLADSSGDREDKGSRRKVEIVAEDFRKLLRSYDFFCWGDKR